MKEFSLCHKQKFLNIFLQFDVVNFLYFKHLILQNAQFKISKVHDIGLQIYRDQKIRVFDKDSTIPFTSLSEQTEKFANIHKNHFHEKFAIKN